MNIGECADGTNLTESRRVGETTLNLLSDFQESSSINLFVHFIKCHLPSLYPVLSQL